jgi:hypothetical protein
VTQYYKKFARASQNTLAGLGVRTPALRGKIEVLKTYIVMIFDVFNAVKMRILFFWVITPYSLAGGYQRFGGTYCLRLQGEDMLLRTVGNHMYD